MRARIDIGDVEAHTKIRARYLRAMENEEWELLPGPVYVKSFLRTYGDFLGLDSRLLIDEFKRRFERPSEHELPPVAPLGPERERHRPRRGIPPWAIIAVVLVAVVVALALIGSANNPPSNQAPTGLKGRPVHPRGGSQARRPAPAPPPRRLATLDLVPTGQVYVCLVDGTGRRLIPGRILAAGQRIPSQSAARMLLTLGNASVRMKVNGAPVKVRPSAASIGYELSPSGSTPLARSRQPRCA